MQIVENLTLKVMKLLKIDPNPTDKMSQPDKPPIDLHLIFEKLSLKNHVGRT